MIRSVQSIYPPPDYHWVGNGFRVHNFFPANADIGIYRMSPRFLMDYASKLDVLILSGELINETIVPFGPVVMNTKEEIQQAYDDYQGGRFGHLE